MFYLVSFMLFMLSKLQREATSSSCSSSCTLRYTYKHPTVMLLESSNMEYCLLINVKTRTNGSLNLIL